MPHHRSLAKIIGRGGRAGETVLVLRTKLKIWVDRDGGTEKKDKLD